MAYEDVYDLIFLDAHAQNWACWAPNLKDRSFGRLDKRQEQKTIARGEDRSMRLSPGYGHGPVKLPGLFLVKITALGRFGCAKAKLGCTTWFRANHESCQRRG